MTNTASTALDAAELIPLALIIALSPFSIIPGILVLHTPRPRPTSLAFLAGWTLGIAGVTAAFVAAADITRGLGNQPGWAPYVRIGIGLGLIAWATYRWFTRNRSATSPRWLTAMTSIGPRRAFLTAAVLTVANAKVLLMCAAAGIAIGTSSLSATGAWAVVVGFTVLATSTVAAPVLAFQIAGDRLDGPLARLKTWMEQNHTALIAAILFIIGVALLYKGIHGLQQVQ
ncbi:MAG: GAP family protein [Mycobacterium sp.]